MVVLTYALAGALEHKDSLGTGAVIWPGDWQRMTAGTGIRYSEFNHSPTKLVHLLQIWILPNRKGLHPGYAQRSFQLDGLTLVASPTGRDGSLTLHQDALVYAAKLPARSSFSCLISRNPVASRKKSATCTQKGNPVMKPRSLIIALVALLAGQAVLAADVYKLDPAHTEVGFTISHLVINTVRGRFKDAAGTVTMDGPALVAAQATIQTKSIDTGIAKRDAHLRSPDFFDVEKFLTLTFESVKAENGSVTGMLTMHGVTRKITLSVTIKGPIQDPWGKERIGIHATGTLNRKDYGLTWNKLLETGGLMVGDEVGIEINGEAVKE